MAGFYRHNQLIGPASVELLLVIIKIAVVSCKEEYFHCRVQAFPCSQPGFA